jgi:hypothetical protein
MNENNTQGCQNRTGHRTGGGTGSRFKGSTGVGPEFNRY